MNLEEIKNELCYYDRRNPEAAIHDDQSIEEHKLRLNKTGKGCSCDNCFYGRTPLANYILSLLEKPKFETLITNMREMGFLPVLWKDEDVKKCADDLDILLSEEDVKNIMSYLEDSFDANEGINWNVIENAIKYYQG
jgi:hypothetical protein